MALHKEIEIKWNATGVSRKSFNRDLKEYLKTQGFKRTIIRVKGDDVYYRIGDNNPIRHRHGGGTHELTVKGRLSVDSITVRFEKNLKFAPEVQPLDVHLALKTAGFEVDCPIFKDCDIYYIDDNGREVQVVWYKCTKDRGQWRYFIEIEIPNLPQKKSLQLLAKWQDHLGDVFGLTDQDIERQSLYEIFSGRQYKVSKEKS